MTNQKVVRALEIGFGTTSLVKGVREQQNRFRGKPPILMPEIMTFPSFVAPVENDSVNMSGDMHSRDTVTVEIADADSLRYEIGPDAHLAAGIKSARVLSAEYITTPQYKALFYGSLVYMNEPEIDMLVLGLPVEDWKARRDQLKDLVVGEHTVNGKTYKIKDAWIIAQPMAGLLAYAATLSPEQYQAFRQSTNLAVDPGYGTFDFALAFGLKVNDARSGGRDLGMSVILDKVEKNLRGAFPSLSRLPVERIDEAFWKNKTFIRLNGNHYPFPVCQGKDVDGNPVDIQFDIRGARDEVIRQAMTVMKNQVGDGGDIDNVILLGGPAPIYKEKLIELYGAKRLIELQNPIKSVCAGMFFGGVQYLDALERKAQAQKAVA
ncbi:MAG: hypothetical protein GJ680_07370 [Alteromonadaceae bacterium]|nr:hypothetical protein [Alteromonadaceae bacterium]